MAEMYVVVDKGVCIACGSCQCWSPDVFSYDKLSLAENRLDGNTGTLPIPEVIWEDVIPTFTLCPTKAIKGSDKPFVNFKQTPEFQTESPDNPQISYDLEDSEITVNELNKDQPGHSCGSGGCGCK